MRKEVGGQWGAVGAGALVRRQRMGRTGNKRTGLRGEDSGSGGRRRLEETRKKDGRGGRKEKRTMEGRRGREVSLLGAHVHRGRVSAGASGASLT